ncbi:MAG: hypothetical protein MI976_26390 [Pseudomonadales bacterium]|nr:hypothetical protein [Pseudomonadales bacterium]
MKSFRRVTATCFLAAGLVACGGGETQRSTSDSADLTGLWRTSTVSSSMGLNATSKISYLMDETGDAITMTSCIERSSLNLSKAGDTLSGLPVGDINIVDNDTLSGSGEYGNSQGAKIALPLTFDMGSLAVDGNGFGEISFSDLCVISSIAKALGVTTYEEYSAGTVFNGAPMEFRLTLMGNLAKGSYTVAREPQGGEASILLRSQALLAVFNRSEMLLNNGTVTITEDSTVWLKGDFSATMPNGELLSGSFELEKP